ncbi:MAG: FkbM family methyltransferase [Sideroxyarcus sp.]
MKLSAVEIVINDKKFIINFREDSEGDRGVIEQILFNQDYDITSWAQGIKLIEYHYEQSQWRPSLIVDAGANIGASVLYFLNFFQNSFVFSVEPEPLNWQLLEINTADYLNNFNFQGAISNTDGEVFLEDPGLSDWGFRTNSNKNEDNNYANPVKSISPVSILSNPLVSGMTPLILKVDIEGGENSLFDGDTSWLEKFPLVIIELHDWLLPFSGSSRNFLRAVSQHEFDFVYRGENIFLFNRNILSK